MAKAVGRRPDETSSEQSQGQGSETWAAALMGGVLVLAITALILLAAR